MRPGVRRDVAKAKNDDLVDEIEVIRNRLAGTVDELLDRANPKNIAKRRLEDVKAHFVDEQGSPRLENIIPIATGAVGLIAVIVLIRRLAK